MTTQISSDQKSKLVGLLKVGDRLLVDRFEMKYPQAYIEAKLVAVVEKLAPTPAGFVEVVTNLGTLRSHFPTDKVFLAN